MNNIVLDVAIGLVFIYLLYSLLASTINEFIAMLLAYRHRMLEKGIEQMLDGKNYSYYWWDKAANYFFWLYHKLPFWVAAVKNEIVKKNDEPKIDNNNELRIENNNNKEEANKSISRKDFFKTCNISSQTRGSEHHKIRRRKLNKKAALFAANITNHPLYRRKSEDSILYKKPAYLTASAFSDILFDVLSNRRSEINSLPILMNDIKAFVGNHLEDNKDLKSILNVYIEQANGDVQKFKLLLEDWFDDTMNRVSGWYKRQATKVLFFIGLILAITFNISTIDIVHKLSVNKDLRETMAKSASAYVENSNKSQSVSSTNSSNNLEQTTPEQVSSTNYTAKGSIDTTHKQTTKQQNAPASDTTDKAFANVQQQIKNIQKLYKDTIAEINMMMGLGWDSSILYRNFKKTDITVNGKEDSVWKVNKDSINWFNNGLQWLLPTCIFNGYYMGLSVIRAALAHPISLIGFLITALAITLGAPFWFDLLNKFVNIRAGGNKPSEDAGSPNTKTVSKNGTLNQKSAPNSFA